MTKIKDTAIDGGEPLEEGSLVAARRMRLPALIEASGRETARGFLEFLVVPIRNPRTRAAYLTATTRFLDWCDLRGLTLEGLEPIHVAAYVEGHHGSPATVRQHIAAIRSLLSWLVARGVIPSNPAREVRSPRLSRSIGRTPALSNEDMVRLFESVDTSTLSGLRDLAFLSTMAYTFARVSAVTSLRARDYVQIGRRTFLRLREKGGKERDIPCHHLLEERLDAWLAAAGADGGRNAPLFRSVRGRGAGQTVTDRPLSRTDAWAMVRRRLRTAGVARNYCCHSFRATGITNYLENGGTLEMAQHIAGHSDSRTTKLYDRRGQRATLDDMERIRY